MLMLLLILILIKILNANANTDEYTNIKADASSYIIMMLIKGLTANFNIATLLKFCLKF